MDHVLPQLRETGTATLPGAPAIDNTAALDALRAQLAAIQERLDERTLPAISGASSFTPAQRAALLKGHITRAAKLYAKADNARSVKSWRMHVDTKVRTTAGFVRGARCSYDNMPTATWERAMVAAMQEVATAERIAPLLTDGQGELPIKKPN